MSWTLYKDLVLDVLKSKKVLATDSDGKVISGEGADGTFTTADVPAKTITVVKGIITEIT